MAAVCGSGIVLSFKDNAGTPAYQVVAGLRSRSIAINSEAVDVTNASTSGRFRTLLDGCGIQSLTISGDGIFEDDTATDEIREAIMAGANRDSKILIPGYGTFEGSFKPTSFEMGGEYNDSVTFSITLESAGTITFTAA